MEDKSYCQAPEITDGEIFDLEIGPAHLGQLLERSIRRCIVIVKVGQSSLRGRENVIVIDIAIRRIVLWNRKTLDCADHWCDGPWSNSRSVFGPLYNILGNEISKHP